MDAIYLLSPELSVVDCLLADFDQRRYRKAFLVWTNLLDPGLRRRIDDHPMTRQMRSSSKTLFVDFYSRESNLAVFRDPWSFPMLYHPACNSLIPKHMQALAQKVCLTFFANSFKLADQPDCGHLHYSRRIPQSAILPTQER